MTSAFPVLWTFHGAVPAVGLAEVDDARVVLTSRSRSLSFPLGSIDRLDVLRAAAERVRGLPVLALCLEDGDVVRVASLGGAGSLHELTAAVDGRWRLDRLAKRSLRGHRGAVSRARFDRERAVDERQALPHPQ
jgi:hypothetical protein